MIKFNLLFTVCSLFCLFLTETIAIASTHSEATIKHGGRCTGSASCRACKNCKYCGHCNSGGSCGVCGGGFSSRTGSSATYNYGTSGNSAGNSYSKRSSAARSGSFISNTLYQVSSTTLNVRSGPGKDYPFLDLLEYGEIVEVLGYATPGWVKNTPPYRNMNW